MVPCDKPALGPVLPVIVDRRWMTLGLTLVLCICNVIASVAHVISHAGYVLQHGDCEAYALAGKLLSKAPFWQQSAPHGIHTAGNGIIFTGEQGTYSHT